ncbi:MAG: response regulator [Chloroflexi bacterium]|nr:response regulator [Chloroflexota bacterium]
MDNSIGRILIAANDVSNRETLASMLHASGYTVEAAEEGQKALEMVRDHAVDVILLDCMMPGVDVLAHLKGDASLRHIPIIVISTMDDMECAVHCIETGAADHLTKPFNPVLLQARVNASLAVKRLHDQEELHRREIEEYNGQLESKVKEQVGEIQAGYRKLQKAMDSTVLALSSAVERRDPYTAGHQRRVAQLAAAIGKEMGLPEAEVAGIRVAGILHDIGKICVPAEILCKPGRITEAEFSVIKDHPGAGCEILKTIEFAWPIAGIVRQHQERFDGSGYPSGLSGDNILREASIIAVADVMEAMSSHRPYRPALGTSLALGEITSRRGVFYRPDAVDACVRLFENKRFVFE